MAGSNGNYSRYVYVYNKTRETFVATEAAVADSYLRRLIGLLGKTKRWAKLGRGLWIIPSRGVHSIGMLFPIDLVIPRVQGFSESNERAGIATAHDLPDRDASGRRSGDHQDSLSLFFIRREVRRDIAANCLRARSLAPYGRSLFSSPSHHRLFARQISQQ